MKQVLKPPKSHFKSVSLRNEISLNFAMRAPITEELFSAIKHFCEDEEIKEYEMVKNILICGGGSLLPSYNNKHAQGKTLGGILEESIVTALANEMVPPTLQVLTSEDPRLCILQGARILMNLSGSEALFVNSADYYENGAGKGKQEEALIN